MDDKIDTSKLDLSALEGLSEKEKAFALQLLREIGTEGYSKTYEDLRYSDFEEIPVDIETFLHDRKYLGNGLYDADGRFTLYPYWEEKLKEIFPDNITTAYNTIVLTGAIGLGKSLVAVIILLYMLYRLLCLKDPYVYYGLQSIDKLTISFMNITLENAKGVALDKLNQFVLGSEWFLAHGEMAGKTNLVYRPQKHIELIAASSNNQIIGRCLFCLSGDTIIRTVDGDKTLTELAGKTTRVYSLNENNEIVLSEECSIQPTIKTKEEIEIELDDGYIIHCTPEHRFMLIDGSYKAAKDLTENDELFGETITYDYFIDNIIANRGQHNIPNGEYYEKHHIMPRCLGGSDSTENLIWLYPYEHYLAHKLLCKKYPSNRKLKYALHCFNQFNKGNSKRQIDFSENEYNECRELALKGRGGYSLSEKTKYKMSQAVQKRIKEHPEQFSGWDHQNKIAITNDSTHESKYILKNESLSIGWRYGLPKHKKHVIKDINSYRKQKQEQVSGKNNPMYGKGYLLTGGKNGNAKYIYTFDNVDYACRKDLLTMLQQMYPTISESTIRTLMKNPQSERIYKKFPEIVKKLSWRLK